jgi:hypothetical protein
MKNGPALWDAVLASIPREYPAIIAGGAVRDYLLDFEPKDIDVFVKAPDQATFLDLATKLPAEFDICDMGSGLDYARWAKAEAAVPFFGVLDGTARLRGARWKVQFIGRAYTEFTGEAVTDLFDIGLTQAWYDGTRTHQTEAAKKDQAEKTVTVLHNEGPGIWRSRDRAHAFRERHPEFKVNDHRKQKPSSYYTAMRNAAASRTTITGTTSTIINSYSFTVS